MGLSFKSMIKIIGILTLIEGVFMLPVVFTAIHFEEWQASRAFADQDQVGKTGHACQRWIFYSVSQLGILFPFGRCPYVFLWKPVFVHKLFF